MPEENLKLKCVTGGKLLHCAEINIPIELGAEVNIWCRSYSMPNIDCHWKKGFTPKKLGSHNSTKYFDQLFGAKYDASRRNSISDLMKFF